MGFRPHEVKEKAMGGSRLSKYGETVRIDKEEHDDLIDFISGNLAKFSINAQTIPHVRNKESFGDIDLLCTKSDTHADLPETSEDVVRELDNRDKRIAEALNAVAYTRGNIGNPTVSFLLNGKKGLVQVDLTSIKDHLLDFARSHLSWGDAGSLSSVVARQMSLKVGMSGLSLCERNEYGNVFKGSIDYTYSQALELSGYDAKVHAEGFDTNEDIFRWIASGRYFDPKIWSPEWMTNKSRRRALKRPVYHSFLTWMQDEGVKRNYDWGETKGEKSSEWFLTMSEKFPEAVEEIEKLKDDLSKKEGVKAFYTSQNMKMVTGLDGKELNKVMNDFRKDLGEENLKRLAEKNDLESLKNAFLEFVK